MTVFFAMNNNSSNPFLQLAKDFAAGRKKEKAVPQSPVASPVHAHDPSLTPGGESEERALFLDAISRIKPLNKKNVRNDHHTASISERSSQVTGSAHVDLGNTENGVPNSNAVSCALPEREAEQKAQPPVGGSFSSAETANPDATFDGMTQDEEDLFARVIQDVKPIGGKGRAVPVPAGRNEGAPGPEPARVLQDLLEGRVEFSLCHTDEFMEGHVLGIDPLVPARLRAGRYSPEKHLDLHGMNARQAYDALIWFIRDAYRHGLRCVVVVTGRGRNSPDGVGILRLMLQRWLSRDPLKRVVLAFCTARPGDGGTGAAYVLLRKHRKNMGKIIWDHTPADDDFSEL